MAKKKVKKKTVSKKLINEHEIAMDFATKVYQKFQEVIKSIILFGSVSKGTAKGKHDIDIVIIIDDCVINWDEELIAWYREELSKMVSNQKYAERLHLNTVTLTTFWEELKAGEPLIINILRYGKTLIDYGGFFDPLKVLLARGRIKPSPEAVFVTLRRAIDHEFKAHNNLLLAAEGLYWAMTDSAHAALMAENATPPSPEHIAEMLDKIFVKNKMLSKKYIPMYEELRKVYKGISHGEIKSINGKQFDNLANKTQEFVNTMRILTQTLIRNKKIIKAKF